MSLNSPERSAGITRKEEIKKSLLLLSAGDLWTGFGAPLRTAGALQLAEAVETTDRVTMKDNRPR